MTKEYLYLMGQAIALNELTPQVTADYPLNTVDALGNTATWQVDPVLHSLTLNAPAEGINTTFNITADNWWEEPDIGQASRNLAFRINMVDGRTVIAILNLSGTNISGRLMIYSPPTAPQYMGLFELAGTSGSPLVGTETLSGGNATLHWDANLNTLALTEPTGIMSGVYPIDAGNRFSMTTSIGNATLLFYTDAQQCLLTALLMESNGYVVANALAQIGDLTLADYVGNGTTLLPPLNTLYQIHTDHLGTPRVITDVNNTTVWSWHSDPFGKTAANEDPDGVGFEFNLRFAGQYYDWETGLHYNYFRNYDPATGRYLESDPIGLAGGLNTYGYVGGNPLYWVDPFGLKGKGLSGLLFPRSTPFPMTTPAGDHITYSNPIQDLNDALTVFGWNTLMGITKMCSDSSDGDHANDREEEAKTDKNRQVGDTNKVTEKGRTFTDSDTGNTIHVDGDRVVVTDGNGRKITQFKNPRKNTQDRIRRGRWVPF